jgi:nucleoside-diphosphate-sugar epimerase
MSILVAGGAGFIGSHLVKALVEKGEKVVVFDLHPHLELKADLTEGVRFIQGDATDITDVLHAVKQFEVKEVYHFIALLADVSQKKPLLAQRVNVESTLNFLETARILNLRRIIFASSVAVYDPKVPSPVKEDAPLRPASVYGATKVLSEFYGMHYHRMFGIDFRALRFTTVYGLGKSGGSTGPCSKMIENAAAGLPTLIEAADAVTDWIYVKDAVDSLLRIRKVQNPNERIYNIGGQTLSVRELAGVVKRFIPNAAIDLEEKYTFPWPPSYDCSKALDELGYSPSFNIEEGIKDFVQEVRIQSGLPL